MRDRKETRFKRSGTANIIHPYERQKEKAGKGLIDYEKHKHGGLEESKLSSLCGWKGRGKYMHGWRMTSFLMPPYVMTLSVFFLHLPLSPLSRAIGMAGTIFSSSPIFFFFA